MGVDSGLRIFVELILAERLINSEEATRRYPSLSSSFLIDFFAKMRSILYVKKRVAAFMWGKFFDTCCDKMCSSHQKYLTFVTFACNSEHKCHQNIFDSFISVCGVVKFLYEETLLKIGVNFHELNSEIIMVFYSNQLKSDFCRNGGCRKLAEYILHHEYLQWDFDNLPLFGDPAAYKEALETKLQEKLVKELKRDRITEQEIDANKAENDTTSMNLAKTVLSITSVKLPTLPYRPNPMTCRQKVLAKKAARKLNFEVPNADLLKSFNCESKTNHTAKQDKNKIFKEIIPTVIEHNLSKNLDHENANKIQETNNTRTFERHN